MNDTQFTFGVTGEFDCNYLPDNKERLLIAVDERFNAPENYAWLMQEGFRRSGDQVYRPHCVNCQACHSVRLPLASFEISQSQRRLLKKNKAFSINVSGSLSDEYYPLYERYINTLHSDGTMYPANEEQYKSFIENTISKQLFLEVWHGEKLISVAVTDVLTDSLSAVYTFYDPDYRKHGLGIYSILQQINYGQRLNAKFLYLGYQIDACQKMNYKTKFHPHQRLVKNQWQIINK